MAKEDKDSDTETEEAEPKSRGSSTVKLVLAAVIVSSLLSGGIVGVTLYLVSDNDTAQVAKPDKDQDEEAEDNEENVEEPEVYEAPSGPAIYIRMDPNFVVSFSEQRLARFMQFSLQVMTRDKALEDIIKAHMPAVRSNLFLLFNSQSAEAMMTREGKENLLIKITEDINKTLENVADISGVEAAYFDSFVIQ